MTTDVLVAGIGNILMGDDGFGVEVVRRLAKRHADRDRDGARADQGASATSDVRFVDFGIRSFDLAFALSNGPPHAAILIDAAARGKAPGTITVLEPHEIAEASVVETHGMHPLRALELARTLGGVPNVIRVVACEPETLASEEEPMMGLSANVEAAVVIAMQAVDTLIDELRRGAAQ